MPPRVMIIGLDGATFEFVRPLAEAGRLPTLASLMARGASGELRSTFPAQTAAAWTTCITGQRPGTHGVFYFHELDPTSYSGRGRLTTSESKRGRTIFDVAGAQGMRVASMHVPATFPTWPVNGVMVSGYPTPMGSPACAYPCDLEARVSRLYELTKSQAPERRLRAWLDHIELLTDICEETLVREQPDLFMTVHQESDLAHHFFWRYYDPRCPAYTARDAQRYGDYIAQIYMALDRSVARLLMHAGPDTTIFVVSDHGGTLAAPNAFHVNAWLASEGYLQLSESAPSLLQRAYAVRRFIPASLRARVIGFIQRKEMGGVLDQLNEVYSGLAQVDRGRTQAYRFIWTAQVEGIVLNVAGRQPQGIVQPGAEYEALRDQIIARLRDLRTPDTNEPAVAEIYRREEICTSEYMDHMPDIIVRLHPLYRMGGNVRPPIFSRLTAAQVAGSWSGWHDDDGILIAAGPGIPAGATVAGASILNMAPTFLRALGLGTPAWMEGVVQEGIFVREAELAPVVEVAAVGAGRSDGEGYTLSAREEESIKERLSNLGYL